MQTNILMTSISENFDWGGARTLPPCFLDNFVPEHTEVVPQSRKSFEYINLGKCHQSVPIVEMEKDGLANKMHRDDKYHAVITVGNMVSKVAVR